MKPTDRKILAATIGTVAVLVLTWMLKSEHLGNTAIAGIVGLWAFIGGHAAAGKSK